MSIQTFKAAQRALLDRVGVDAKSLFLDVPSVSGGVHVLRAGEGPPVVMVPGFSDPAVMWAPLMAELEGFTLYAVDRPCFGLTGRAKHDTATVRRLAVAFLEQVLDALHLERPLFVANSVGSLWTMWLGLDRPERLAATVHVGCPALVLGTSAPLPVRLLGARPLGRALMSVMPPSSEQVDRFAAMVGVDLSSLPELRDVLVEAQRLPGAGRATRELVHALVRLRGARPETEVTEEELRRLRGPTLFVWGECDVFGPPRIGALAARLVPGAELHVVPDEGHVPWIAHPEAVAAIAAPFLMRHAAPMLRFPVGYERARSLGLDSR